MTGRAAIVSRIGSVAASTVENSAARRPAAAALRSPCSAANNAPAMPQSPERQHELGHFERE